MATPSPSVSAKAPEPTPEPQHAAYWLQGPDKAGKEGQTIFPSRRGSYLSQVATPAWCEHVPR